MTSAPSCAKVIVPEGPATYVDRSMMDKPLRGRPFRRADEQPSAGASDITQATTGFRGQQAQNTAIGFTRLPVIVGRFSGATMNMNSQRFRSAHISDSFSWLQ